MRELSDDELLAELGVEAKTSAPATRTPREARIVAGFEDIQRFVDEHGRMPEPDENRDIFERLYAVRLGRLRRLDDARALLEPLDRQGLLADEAPTDEASALDDDALLAELGVASGERDITDLRHVRSRAEVRAAEEIASRERCEDFDRFRPLFERVAAELKDGTRETRRFQRMAEIKEGEFFVVGGQTAYVAEVGEEFVTEYDRRDSRLRVIFDNGTESDMLLRSLQRALHRDEAGRRITEPAAGPLFDETVDAAGAQSGTVYVLRSLSDDPTIAANRDLVHKIGVTGGDVERRLAKAERDPTFLMAPVEIVATYTLYDIDRVKLENLLHRFLADVRFDITVRDRFGEAIKPREWFLVPLGVIDEVVRRVQDRTLANWRYDREAATLRPA